MTITLKNFGPIKELTMDLTKNLHLLYGESSVGKSYAAYCVYLFLSNLSDLLRQARRDIWTGDEALNSTFVEMVNEERLRVKVTQEQDSQENEKIVEVNLSQKIASLLHLAVAETFEGKLDAPFQATFGNFLEELGNQYSQEYFSITLATTEFEAEFAFDIDKKILGLNRFIVKVPIIARYDITMTNASSTGGFEHGRLVVRSQSSFFVPLRLYMIRFVAETFQSICSQTYFLPASRLGLYQMHTSFAPILAELSQRRFGLQSSLQLPSLSAPDADYIQHLSQIQPHDGKSQLTELAERIEQNIMKGHIQFDERSKKITFQPQGTKIWKELTHVSSMVAALSPLVLFLKYVFNSSNAVFRILPDDASPQDIIRYSRSAIMLIFEEPEAHLHPTAQVKLMEILAELTKYNVRVMLTSHSDFMFSKLGNLVLGDTINEEDIAVYHLVMTDEGSIDAKDMHITKQEIRETNFADVSEDLYDERLELIESLNEKAEIA